MKCLHIPSGQFAAELTVFLYSTLSGGGHWSFNGYTQMTLGMATHTSDPDSHHDDTSLESVAEMVAPFGHRSCPML